MSTQLLIKKTPTGGYQNIFPKSYTDVILDKLSGMTLNEILLSFNCYFLSYNGSVESTRKKIPMSLRKEGLWITYVLYDHTVITEWYNDTNIDDDSWSNSSNWRKGSNVLVGDLSISSTGKWVINGVETEFYAKGESGITPIIRVYDNKLLVSYNEGETWVYVTDNPIYTLFRTNSNKLQVSTDLGKNWSDISDYIAAWFRWSSDNKIQISRTNSREDWQDFSGSFVDKVRIKKYIGINEELPISGVEEGTIYMKGPYYDVADSNNDNPIYRMWVYAWKGNTLAWQDNGEFQSIAAGVVQEIGDSETEVMSQKAVTTKFSELGSKSVYFELSSKKQYTDRVKELYLEGLDPSKRYYCKYLQRLVVGDYTADQISIYSYTVEDKSDEVQVAVCEDITFSSSVVEIKEKNNSGIKGYWIKHFFEDDRVLNGIASTSDIIIEVVSNIHYSPTIYEYLESKRIRSLISGRGYFLEAEKPEGINNITELYLEGLDETKRYYARINQYHTTGYDANQVYIFMYNLEDKSDAVRVASVEEYTDLSKKVLQIKSYNDSGVNGYVVINNFDKITGGNLYTPDIDVSFVSNINNSPILRELYTSKNPFLKQLVWKNVSNKLKELYLANLDINKVYRFKYFRRIIYGDYQADQIHIYQYDNENLDNPIYVASCEDSTFSKSALSIKEQNDSGIYGYIIKDINENDNLLDLSYYDIDIVAASNLDNSLTILNQFFINPYKITGKDNYGYWGGFDSLFGNYDKDIYVTYEGAICAKDGYLSNVTFGTNSVTVTRFAVGYIDQRGIPIIRTTFKIPSVAWRNNVNLIDKKIKIKSGEQLFVIVGKAEESLYYKRWTEESELQKKHQMLYGSISGMGRLANEFGASICLQWETISVDSIFADKQELQTVEDIAEEANQLAQSALSKIGYFTDRQSNIYKAVVVNGALQLIPLVYKKVLLFCNSTGINGRVYYKGWGGYRGMASSKNGLDYYSHISNGFKQKDSNAEVILKNVWEWEHDFSVGYEQYFSGVSDIDCIIFRAGENVQDVSAFKDNLLSLVDYCIEKFPTAEILITTTTFGHSEKDAILLDVANLRNCLFVKTTLLGKEHHESMGHYLYGDYTPDNGNTWDPTRQVMYKISDNGVANHANDVGMLYMANKILQALQYKQLDLLHNITIGNTNGYTCNVVNPQWVETGVVNVVSNGNSVSVIGVDENEITVTDHNDGVFTFDMPNQDVTINVS